MIGAPVGVDDEVGDEVRPRRLDQDMDALGGPVPLSVSPMIQRTVSPAATGPEPTSCSPGFERDVGDLAGRGIDLIERAVGEGIDLDRVDVAGAGRLHARRAVRLLDAHARIGGFRRRGPRPPAAA